MKFTQPTNDWIVLTHKHILATTQKSKQLSMPLTKVLNLSPASPSVSCRQF